MPKRLIVELEVPSGSRPEKMKDWLGNVLKPHRMEVIGVTEGVVATVDPTQEPHEEAE